VPAASETSAVAKERGRRVVVAGETAAQVIVAVKRSSCVAALIVSCYWEHVFAFVLFCLRLVCSISVFSNANDSLGF
jgi:hypothetical protein